ncbi:MAG: 4-hydroxy-3-methylbut-2-enyl diphosphate reductase [Bacteroidales bacterium]|nr:4-hydroxy-3-methylbut-2-enyl diphosphate reductase [Bacteroidales bacterium]
MQVTIDPHSGFCFGVVHAIEVAERELQNNPFLYCLGDIVHNNMEVNRLKQMGLVIITHEEFGELHDCKVLIRAHGEPPETYQTALLNRIEVIDASCPIVLNLQNVILRGYQEMKTKNGQIVICGKEGHAEVNALNGQTNGTAIIIGNEGDLSKIDFSRPVRLYSQTTKSVDGFLKIAALIKDRMDEITLDHPVDFEWNDSICRQVSNRSAQLKEFAVRFEVVIFVSGQKSSNGMILYEVCKSVNPHTHLVSSPGEVNKAWFVDAETVGICGATSSPAWLMEEIAQEIRKIT